jgi:hypothetical protein
MSLFKKSNKLKKPAMVGSAIFREGVDEKLVVEAAQRQYEYKKDSDKKLNILMFNKEHNQESKQ